MMRILRRKVFVVFIVIVGLISICSFWFSCASSNDLTKQDDAFYRDVSHLTNRYAQPESLLIGQQLKQLQEKSSEVKDADADPDDIPYEEIETSVNDEYTVVGRREGDEVYLPFFGFIQKYFEVYGRLTDNKQRFIFEHSYSKIYKPNGMYTPTGIFMSFEHYNVEVRDRVKCISGIEGVPLSTQWGAHGYYYPIQIAQYGLSHFSKFLIEDKPSVTVYENGEDCTDMEWQVSGPASHVRCVPDDEIDSDVLAFKTPESLGNPGALFHLDEDSNFFMSLDLKFITNGSITVLVETKAKSAPLFHIHYACSQTLIHATGNEIYYGIGDRQTWSHMTRDIPTDFQKGLTLLYPKQKKLKMKFAVRRIVSITLHGTGYVDNITFSSVTHLAQFYYAANWLVRHQDRTGGWPIMVTRKLGTFDSLDPGWYSAMAQGQAISLLTRAYIRTKKEMYLQSALRATKVLNINSQDGGVRATFMDKYVWYEEYPTNPSSFVLNGFIYSLIGLYDLKTIAPPELSGEAEKLFKQGMTSLKHMLPLFDTGLGSIYDLRHVTLGVAPNRARWDYHSTHINQLLLLSTIDNAPILKNTAERWTGYMIGKRAAHN
ncbi:unnamed protein product [Owenia fusiformis]|uniref:heparosan-N-sulfate-glucuronate 5-epimerase n=1 Tax=Owenia fusiformis TaxID=6347 RepID=A0A8J1UD55_OWEFU|nr:unnamed protein product [Owenia fusiformis]